ncbi:MAG: hypothetical protein JXA67_12110 [Micromonosporaceae bacterium]|nr:hypothetical protein [Micromonosporaceae bacterium]
MAALLALVLAAAAFAAFIVAFVVFGSATASANSGTCVNPEGTPWTLDAEQRSIAQLIIDVGRQRGVPPRGWVIAIATAAQEASLHNDLTPDEYGSSGVFQQTPPGWGSREQVNDPTYAAGAFYAALVKVPNWQTLPVTVAAQTVQVSAYPSAYAKHTSTALKTVAELGGVDLDCSHLSVGSAEPAPRNPDGSWPEEGCIIRPDPTTGQGCLTPRTAHVIDQARAAGYGKPGCYRPSGPGEHPKGRACDWMMTSGGAATGEQKARGDQFATWAVANADRLGIMYVIWYRQIWTPSQGWHAYTNPWGGDDPSGWHTNHVHISVY